MADLTTTSAGANGGPGWKRIGLAVMSVFIVAALALVVYHTALLGWIGTLMVVEDELVAADVIVPLAGGNWDREIEAAELFRAGYAPRVAFTQEPKVQTQAYLAERGIHLRSAVELRLEVFAKLGVPRDRIVVLDEPVASTLDEARIVGAWAEQAGVRSVIIVTTPYHTARAKYVFDRYASSSGVRFIVRPSSVTSFRPDSWWTRRDTLRESIFELEKLIAYRLRY